MHKNIGRRRGFSLDGCYIIPEILGQKQPRFGKACQKAWEDRHNSAASVTGAAPPGARGAPAPIAPTIHRTNPPPAVIPPHVFPPPTFGIDPSRNEKKMSVA